MDIVLASSWRLDNGRSGSRGSGASGGRGVSGIPNVENEGYIWRQGRSEVHVRREGDQWKVQYSTVGRLFGPRQVIYEQSHRVAKHAAWDVMARVIRATQSEDEGLRAAEQAARWMRDAGA